jgi:hypothetical protein
VGSGYHNPPPLENLCPRRSTPIQEPLLLATSVCLVPSYAMPCHHSGPTYTMRHIPEPPSSHTPMKPRGSALIPLVTPSPIPRPVVLTPGSSLGSYIVNTYQHRSFLAQGLIEIIECPYQQGASSFSESCLERTSKLSVLGLEQFRMGDRPGSFLGCA